MPAAPESQLVAAEEADKMRAELGLLSAPTVGSGSRRRRSWMPITREPHSVDDHASEESAVRRAPLDQDDAYELADHEFTLVAEDAADDSRGWPYDEHTAPWSTLPPLPPWATKARALLEPPTLPRPLNEETPTLVE